MGIKILRISILYQLDILESTTKEVNVQDYKVVSTIHSRHELRKRCQISSKHNIQLQLFREIIYAT